MTSYQSSEPPPPGEARHPFEGERRRGKAAAVLCCGGIVGAAALLLSAKSSSSSSPWAGGGRIRDAAEHELATATAARGADAALALRTISGLDNDDGDGPLVLNAALEGKSKKDKSKNGKKRNKKNKKSKNDDNDSNDNKTKLVGELHRDHLEDHDHKHDHGHDAHQATERCGWVVDLFTEKYSGTPDDELGPQYRVQSADPNYFYRATADIFWIDFAKKRWGDRLDFAKLGVTTVHSDGEPFQSKSTWTWVTGDQHLSNFGAWRNRHGDIVFGVNDFDEAAIYDFNVDILRIAASVVGHAYANDLSETEVDTVLRAFTDTYVQTVVGYVGGDRELLFEITPDTATGRLQEFLASLRDGKSSKKQLDKFTEKGEDGERRFSKDDRTRLVAVTDEEDAAIRQQFTSRKFGASMMKTGWHVRAWDDSFFDILDIARRVGSGVGSYGVDRYYVLLRGTDEDAIDWNSSDGNAVILDVKYEPPGAVTRILSDDDAAWYGQLFEHDAQRAVEGQRRLTSFTDPFTGWVELGGMPFVVRQRSPWKASPDFAYLQDPADYIEIVEQVAVATATSHSRGTASKSPGQFKHVIAAALGKWSDRTKWGKALAEVAKDYHDQVLLDFECFRTFVDDNYGGSDE